MNCVWGQKPDYKDVLKFFYLLPLGDYLNNLFFSENKIDDNSLYNLYGMLLYSSTLCHYISVIFNMETNTFITYDDDKIKELSSIHELYKEITLERMKKNPKVFFYPVLLIYYREIIYNNETFKLNEYSYIKYHSLKEECLEAKNNPLQKYVNYQQIYDRTRKYSTGIMNGLFDMIVEEDLKDINNKTNIPYNNYYNNFNNINMEKKEENKNMVVEDSNKKSDEKTEKKRTNKRTQTQYINHSKKIDFFNNII